MNRRTVQLGALGMGVLIVVVTAILFVAGIRMALVFGGLGLLFTGYGYAAYWITSVYIDYSPSTQ